VDSTKRYSDVECQEPCALRHGLPTCGRPVRVKIAGEDWPPSDRAPIGGSSSGGIAGVGGFLRHSEAAQDDEYLTGIQPAGKIGVEVREDDHARPVDDIDRRHRQGQMFIADRTAKRSIRITEIVGRQESQAERLAHLRIDIREERKRWSHSADRLRHGRSWRDRDQRSTKRTYVIGDVRESLEL
jgi:hypothetical protein